MARKAKKQRVDELRRMAPTEVTPAFTPGDVLTVMSPDVWADRDYVPHFSCLLYAAIAALAACAGVTPRWVVEFKLADYRDDRLEAKFRDGHVYPVVLLPVVVAAIEAYLDHRRRCAIGGEYLFVNEKGGKLHQGNVCKAFVLLARRYGHFGAKLIHRLIEFFDDQLRSEVRDRAAVVALKRGRQPENQSRAAIDAATKDRAGMMKVLKRNHMFSGEPGRWLGGHGKSKASKTARLFLSYWPVFEITPVLREDAVCARLLRYDWLEGNAVRRRTIIDDDLPHLVELLDDGSIEWIDIAYLLCCTKGNAQKWVRRHRLADETPAQRETREALERDWSAKLPALYRARPDGEPHDAFFARIKAKEAYPFEFGVMAASLMRSGTMPRQVARKQKKALSGFSRKVEKAVVTVRGNSRNQVS